MGGSFTLSISYLIDEARVWQKIEGNNREAHLNDIQSLSQNATPRDRYYATLGNS